MADGKASDLPVRAASAVVMVLVAGTALWLGGALWAVLVAAIALGVLWEWWGLVSRFAQTPLARGVWMLGGLVYVGTAAWILAQLRLAPFLSIHVILLTMIAAVIGTDVGAYFAGRTFGGPKIAPSISPSKTWSGLLGGMLGAGLVVIGVHYGLNGWNDLVWKLLIGAAIAVVAQSGDFFESWMKRRAGVKDSGALIPGHGGLFDRVDGLLAVSFALGLLMLHSFLTVE